MNLVVWLVLVALLATGCGRSAPTAISEIPPAIPASSAAMSAPSSPGIPLRDKLQFQHLKTEDGLSEGRVWDILQDRQGFMWFTTWDGVNRYDGYEFRVFREEEGHANSPGGEGFWTVEEDQEGMIWVGSHTGGGLSRFDPTTEQWTRYQHDPEDPHSLSSNVVYDVYEDGTGTLWIATLGGGLNRFDGQMAGGSGRFTRYQHAPDDPQSLSDNRVVSVYEDRSGELWIGTLGGGLNRFDRRSGEFVRYLHDGDDPASLSDNRVIAVHEDRSGALWISTYGGGLNRFNRNSGTFTRYVHDVADPRSLSHDVLTDILEDQSGALWISTFGGGLNRYDPQSDSFVSYQRDSSDGRSLGNNTLTALFQDQSGIIWIGTAGSGIDKLDPLGQAFTSMQQKVADPNSLSNNDVRAVLEDRSGALWIGTWGGGLNRYDPETGNFTHYLHDPGAPDSLGNDRQYSLFEDGEGVLWIGFDAGGLDRLEYVTEDGQGPRFTHFEHDPANSQSLSDNDVTALYEGGSGTLWVGTWSGGLNALDRQTETGNARFRHYRYDPEEPNSLGEGIVWAILEDPASTLWVGTAGGGLCRFDRGGEGFACHVRERQNDNSLSNDTVWAIHRTEDGSLWIGTSGGLNRFSPQTGQFTRYTVADGLPHNTVVGILEEAPSADDAVGQLWLSTLDGLSRFDTQSGTFHNYDTTDGLAGNIFNPAAFRTRSGRMLFGSQNGLTAFYPEDVKENRHIPPVHITAFSLANERVLPGNDSVLQRSIVEADELELTYEDRVISFEFAALDYRAPEKNRYRYTLEGFDEGWVEVGSDRRFVTYTNLDPGEYVFRVVGSNNDGVWNEEGTSIQITITPPWWATGWFLGLALALVVASAGAGVWWRINSFRSQQRRLQVMVAERTHELGEKTRALTEANRQLKAAKDEADTANRAKSTFLANMSHELRTPLNAILGFARLMSRDESLSAQQQERLKIIDRSGEHLLDMIGDILTLSRIEAGRERLDQEQFDLGQELKDIGQLFRSRAGGKGLYFTLELADDLPRYLLGDAGKLKQILFNLLDNAVKYTENGGVSLRARTEMMAEDGETVMLQLVVEDSGVGIARDRLDEIFDAFVYFKQASDAYTGTGLGLSIAKSLVELMGGELMVDSEVGRGTRFTVNVPMLRVAADEILPEQPFVKEVIGLKPGQEGWRILVVDDNPENLMLLSGLLVQAGFAPRAAASGEEALSKFKEWKPHFIWMDVRMPETDGYEATEQIRALPGGDQVKIVAVTASVVDDAQEGVQARGLDGLVLKPFRDQVIFDVMARELGVEYIYRDRQDTEVQAGPPVLSAERLAKLPSDLLQNLSQTILIADREAALAVIEEIRGWDTETAEGLRTLVENFQMGPIWTMLNEADTENGD